MSFTRTLSIVTQKCKYTTRSPKRKQTTMYHHGPTRTSPPNKHNLQERRRVIMKITKMVKLTIYQL